MYAHHMRALLSIVLLTRAHTHPTPVPSWSSGNEVDATTPSTARCTSSVLSQFWGQTAIHSVCPAFFKKRGLDVF
eukprot:NODE_1857_length_825_cov_90.940722_g1464_i0.p2 GENE.NODE_1857_length_825_cov_90.940722_g1464_i0~~NODE_1857_length_825_cov_90.940722_g1464_i0.p2  ORF type:complete len:75 (+),score=16.47 NODE_1857_length_825_cov_90.940722_g1464_i0:303-527(+)